MAWLFSSFLVYSVWTLLLSLLISIPLPGAVAPNLTPRLGVSGILLWLLLLLFAMSISTFSYLVSVFFEKVWTAACVGLVSWILLIIFMVVFGVGFSSLGNGKLVGGMLCPPVALDVAFQLMYNGGGTFQTMNAAVSPNMSITLAHCMLMLLLDSCIFMTLAMYLDNVLPSKYGVRKPLLYFIWEMRKFMRRMRAGDNYGKQFNDEDGLEMIHDISQDSQSPFELDPEHAQVAVLIQNLKKIFKWNKKRAVDGLSVKMFTGEIFALLGFNGAGKTTTIGVLTGLTAPTDGQAKIFDFDIRTEMEEIRKYIGLCPQHNLLSNEMSVQENVAFFGRVRGVDDSSTRAEQLLQWLGMPDKLQCKPEELSGGQKRRVQLAIALIGDTKLAFLDEPTSGLDPESRREVWNILLKLRGKVTIILTSQTMEEADVLGDRIGIMSEGKMMCCGTPSFLKNYYGVGYNLKISPKNSECDADKLLNLTTSYIPGVKLNNINEGSSLQEDLISYFLPTTNLDLTRLADLMNALRDRKEQLHVDNIALSQCSMDQVFLKVGEQVNAVTTAPKLSSPPADHQVVLTSNVNRSSTKRQWFRYTTLLRKRILYFSSAPFTLVSLMLSLSVVVWMILTWLSFKLYAPPNAEPPLVVSSASLSSYQTPIVLFHENSNASYRNSYLSQLSSSPSIKIEEFSKNTTYPEMISSLEDIRDRDLQYYRQHYVAGGSFSSATFSNHKVVIKATGYFSAYALHSAPLSFNLISQTLIKKMTGVDTTIEVVNHPFRAPAKYHRYNLREIWEGRVSFLIRCGETMLLVIIITLLTATAVLLPTEERLSKGKQLQLMTGTTPFTYWMAMFSWDFFFFSLVNLIITTTFGLADYTSGNWLFTNHGAGIAIYLALQCHLFGLLWFSYLMSCVPRIETASGGFILINVLALIVGLVWNVIRYILLKVSESELYYGEGYWSPVTYFVFQILFHFSILSGYAAWLVPTYSLFQCVIKLAAISFPNSICNAFSEHILNSACRNVTHTGTVESATRRSASYYGLSLGLPR